MKRARVVIGANFGDEGKGLVTDWLCSQGADWVVRFNGGANAGHTVVTPGGARHIFRHFGSGTLCGVPTYLSKYFVVNPILFFDELAELNGLGIRPVVAVHPDCLVTTHIDMLVNQAKERARGTARHGSCGIGIHETVQRSRVEALKITVADLLSGAVLDDKLREIGGKWARFRTGGKAFDDAEGIEMFVECIRSFADRVVPMGIAQVEDPVFEGAQGLLLSQDNKEFAPHLTHSYTGMRNVRLLCEQGGFEPDVYYVSRTYLTRHGHGPLPGEDSKMRFVDHTNVDNQWQGPLRFAPLDATALRARIANDAGATRHQLVVTHCDQLVHAVDADVYFSGPTRADAASRPSWTAHPQAGAMAPGVMDL